MISTTPSYFFFGLLLAVIVLAIFMFLPFLTPIVLAIALAVIFGPLHRFLVKWLFRDKERSSFGALITLIIITIIIFVPALFVAAKIYSEVQNMYAYLIDESSRSQVITSLNNLTQYLSHALFNLFPAYTFDSFNITDIFRKGLEWVFGNLDIIFSGASKIALSVFVMFLALFYFLRVLSSSLNKFALLCLFH